MVHSYAKDQAYAEDQKDQRASDLVIALERLMLRMQQQGFQFECQANQMRGIRSDGDEACYWRGRQILEDSQEIKKLLWRYRDGENLITV